MDQHEAAVVERLVDVGSLEGSSSPSSPLFPQRQRHYQQSNSGEKYHLPVPSLSKWSGAVDCHDDTSRSSGTDSFVTANEHFIFVSSDEMAHAGARRTGTDHCSLNSSSAGVGGGDSSGDVFYYSAVSSASASSQKPQQQQPLSSSLASANKTIIPLNDLPSPFITQQQRSTAPTTETFTRNNAIPPLHSFSGGKKFAAAPPAPTTTAATDAGDISVVCVDNDGTSTSTVWTDQIQMIANQLKQFSVDVEPHKLPQKHVF